MFESVQRGRNGSLNFDVEALAHVFVDYYYVCGAVIRNMIRGEVSGVDSATKTKNWKQGLTLGVDRVIENNIGSFGVSVSMNVCKRMQAHSL